VVHVFRNPSRDTITQDILVNERFQGMTKLDRFFVSFVQNRQTRVVA
jgi:hypothetical protein